MESKNFPFFRRLLGSYEPISRRFGPTALRAARGTRRGCFGGALIACGVRATEPTNGRRFQEAPCRLRLHFCVCAPFYFAVCSARMSRVPAGSDRRLYALRAGTRCGCFGVALIACGVRATEPINGRRSQKAFYRLRLQFCVCAPFYFAVCSALTSRVPAGSDRRLYALRAGTRCG